MLPRESDGRKEEEYEGWSKVRRRKENKMKVNSRQHSESSLTSFYVCNLPGDANKKEIRGLCQKVGRLEDIYLAVNRTGATKQERSGLHSGRDTRTFADAAKGMPAPAPSPPPLRLSCIKEVQDWCNTATLIGEIKNFDTLCNFPSLLSLEGFDVSEIKYLGGMQVIVKFNSDRAAKVFKANKNIWLKWFIWVESNSAKPVRFERIAWIKITGVPLQAWDESNMEAVAGNFGKVLVNTSPFWNNEDVSHGKICILTASCKKINEELVVAFDGGEHRIGVFEVDDDWIPFKKFDASSASETDEELDDEYEFPEPRQPPEIDMEDGEFISKTNTDGGGFNFPAHDTTIPVPVNSGGNPDQIPREANHAEAQKEPLISPELTNAGTGKNTYGEKQSGSGNEGTGQTGPHPLDNGPNSNNGPGSPLDGTGFVFSSPEFEDGGIGNKRKRIKGKVNHRQPKSKSKVTQSGPTQSQQRISSPSIDLNRDGAGAQNSGENSPSMSSSYSREIAQTVAVGTELGFYLENEGEQFVGILCGDGVKKVCP
ncbi:hypothetical protein LXL04_030813 [Taraxacum kok-saghyz]